MRSSGSSLRSLAFVSALTLVFAAASCAKSPTTPTEAKLVPPNPSSPEPLPSAYATATPDASVGLDASAVDAASPTATASRRTDTIATSIGDFAITPIHHATVLFEIGGKTIYLDPWTEGDLDGLPPADFIVITDIHPDHLDVAAIKKISNPATVVVGPKSVAAQTKVDIVIANGEKKSIGNFGLEAIPMYNSKRGPGPGKLFHDKGRGNGYVFTFGDKRVYVSGDTECTSEMKALKNIDVAFVCMNLPYTMTPAEAATCVEAFEPKVVFPFHFRGQDPKVFEAAVKSKKPNVDVRIRQWYSPNDAAAAPAPSASAAPKK